MSVDGTALVEDVRHHTGDALRAVATYRENRIEFHFLRDDVAEEYTAEELDDIRESALLGGLLEPQIKDLYQGRRLECQMVTVEGIHVFHFKIDDASGYIVSLDMDGLSDLNSFIEDCTSHAEA